MTRWALLLALVAGRAGAHEVLARIAVAPNGGQVWQCPPGCEFATGYSDAVQARCNCPDDSLPSPAPKHDCRWVWFDGASHWCDSGNCTRGGCCPNGEEVERQKRMDGIISGACYVAGLVTVRVSATYWEYKDRPEPYTDDDWEQVMHRFRPDTWRVRRVHSHVCCLIVWGPGSAEYIEQPQLSGGSLPVVTMSASEYEQKVRRARP